MTLRNAFNSLLAIAFFVMPLYALGQSGDNSQPCRVKVAAPLPGATADNEVMVEGTAHLPAGGFLWVFIGLRGQAGYWPQGGGPAQLDNEGKWEVLARLGTADDKGRAFVIVPVIVDSTTHEMLQRYVNESSKTHDFQPFPKLPGVVQGCPIVPVNVTRNRT
ncbi:MAG TPA: hypothetical protein VHA33_06595 [Candidatus Angelobacter sp.]|jgi:hypothetical protein|nr:hypothetical protein [Candidatus Angelobacter sp.]